MTPAGEAAFAHKKEAKSAVYAYEQSLTRVGLPGWLKPAPHASAFNESWDGQ
jgi:hypothetical protein